MPHKDPVARRAYLAKYRPGWAAKNPDKERAYEAASKKRYRDRINAMKNGRPCMDCGGYFPPVCMDFDHRDPSNKSFSVAGSKRRLWILLEEISKCDLVCANCHRIRTQNQWDSGVLGVSEKKEPIQEQAALSFLDGWKLCQ
jgi:hypothetical protein